MVSTSGLNSRRVFMKSKDYRVLDTYTFGKSPAAVYLVKILNDLQDNYLSRKVGRFLSDKRNLLSSIEESNKKNILNASQVTSLCALIRKDVNFTCDQEVVQNLCNNIVKGHISSILRRSAKLKIVENQQVSFASKVKSGKAFPTKFVNSDGVVVGYLSEMEEDEPLTPENLSKAVVRPKYHLNDMKDIVTSESLTEKWKARMQRTGKMKP